MIADFDWTGATGDEIALSILEIKEGLCEVPTLPTENWQSRESGTQMSPLEFQNIAFSFKIPVMLAELQELIRPNLPWAEDHFQERVSRIPHNPPPSSSWWPYAQVDNERHKHGEMFSHTYPERYWPKQAGLYADELIPDPINMGIRYHYGDLDDVLKLLCHDRYTRQAYLPIFFPEDTGSSGVDNQRIPCSLGYHFMIRPFGGIDRLNINYYMRSCDIMRHFVDDIYMAARLAQWAQTELNKRGRGVGLGFLDAFIASLHLFEGDRPIIKAQRKQWNKNIGVGFSHAASA